MEELNEIEINTEIFKEVDRHRSYYLSEKYKYNEALLYAVNKILI